MQILSLQPFFRSRIFCKGIQNEPLPLGNDINNELKRVFNINSKRDINLSQTCQKIKLTNNDALIRYLRDKYIVRSYDPVYNNVNKFPVSSIFTTNIDDLIERIYKDSRRRKLICVMLKYMAMYQKKYC